MNKLLIFFSFFSVFIYSQDITGDWIKKTDYSTFNLSFTPIINTEYCSFEIIGNTYSYDYFIKDTINFPAHIGLSYGDKESYHVILLKKKDNHLYGYYNDKISMDKEMYDELYNDNEDPCQFEFYIFQDSVVVNTNQICNFMYGGYSTNFRGTYFKK